MYSSMEIVVLAATRQVKGSTDVEQGRLNDGADGGELAELRTTAAAPERTVGVDGFRASAIASDSDRRWTFLGEDVAGCSVVGHGHRDSVSDVVENDATIHFVLRLWKGERGGLPGFAGQAGFSAA